MGRLPIHQVLSTYLLSCKMAKVLLMVILVITLSAQFNDAKSTGLESDSNPIEAAIAKGASRSGQICIDPSNPGTCACTRSGGVFRRLCEPGFWPYEKNSFGHSCKCWCCQLAKDNHSWMSPWNCGSMTS